MTAAEQVEKIFREEHGRVLAALISQFEDFDLAEDALQDALVHALERWEVDGIPKNPGAWLTTVAKRRAIDRIRRSTTLERSLATLDPPVSQEEPEMDDAQFPDDRLKLMFTCCHPSLALEAQVILTLNTLGGLKTPEIARRSWCRRRPWHSASPAPAGRSATPVFLTACRPPICSRNGSKRC